MNRKQYRDKAKILFGIEGIIAISILVLVSCLYFYTTGLFDAIYNNYFIDYFNERGSEFIVFTFFIFTGIYILYLYLKFMLSVPKKIILICKKSKYGHTIFYDLKGKQMNSRLINDNFKSEKKYVGIIKGNFICEITDEKVNNSDDKVILKANYWLNFYSPYFECHDILFLPVIYIIFILGLLALIFLPNSYKLYALLEMSLPLNLLIYDLLIKLNINDEDELERINQYNNLIGKIINAIPYILLLLIVVKNILGIDKDLFIGKYSVSIILVLITLPLEIIFNILLIFEYYKAANIIKYIIYSFLILFVCTSFIIPLIFG